MENLLEHLNPEQVKAVTHPHGPLMIIAGAGTGKTMVITHRIGWLIEQKLAGPQNILALTFTDKAAAEMEERVDILLPYGYVDLQISTFHSFCEKVLRDYGIEIGLSRDFLLVNELDAWLLTRQNLDRFELDYYRPLGNPTKYLKSLLKHFSRAKDEMITTDDYLSHAEQMRANLDALHGNDDADSEVRRVCELAKAYHTYQQILLENDSLDFGDLVMYTLQLLQKRPRVLKELRERFTYILVDEFQDTNWAQYELIKLLAAPRNNITVVGDDDQAIYKFRGASLANILQFESDYPDCARVVLAKNYRSGQSILDHAYKFIQLNNPNRLESRGLVKKLDSQRDREGAVRHLHFKTLEDETRGVAEEILRLRREHPDAQWRDCSVLVRANSSANDFISAFERHGIPYQYMALRGLYVKPVILDLLAILRVIDNTYHSPSLYRVLTHPLFGLSSHDIVTLNYEAKRRGRTLYEICRSARTLPTLSVASMAMIESILSKIEHLAHQAKTRSASEMVVLSAKESGLLEYENHLPEQKKQDDFRFLHQLYERVKRFEARQDNTSLHQFLEEFQHEREVGEEGSLTQDIEMGPDVVRIMTVHGSKGLEFRFVFVVNLVDRRFPTSERKEPIELPSALVKEKIPEGDLHLEEERRLFYVAMTRAKDALYFTSAEDYNGARKKKLSRFLVELGIEPIQKEISVANIFAPEDSISAPEKTMVYELPKQFSFTQLRAFQTCPLQYKFAHILKIPVFESWMLSYGKTMHNTLHAWFRLWLERRAKPQTSLFATINPHPHTTNTLPASAEELLRLFDKHWIDLWYRNDREREMYRQKGKDSLKQYVAILEQSTPRPMSLEQGFTLKLGDVVIKGRMDRIDEIEGGVEIIDYKTGAPKEKLEADDRTQLLLYQLAIQRVLRLVPKKLTYHYLDDHSEQSFLGSPEELRDLEGNIAQVIERMRSSQFEATPGFHCRFCDFSDICEFRQ